MTYKLINNLNFKVMKDRIELLVKLGLSEQHATDFIKNIADEPAIVGESLGKSGMNFYEWWEIKMKPNE